MKILKITIALMLAAMCVFCFVACQNLDNGGSNAGAGNTQSTGGGSNNNNSANVFVVYKNVKIQLGAKADPIIASLGEPQSKTEIGDCGGLGAQVRYIYPSIEIYVLQSKTEGNIIDQITFRDDLMTTPEGVYIGMTADEAMSLIGEPTKETDTAISYVYGKYTLKLSVEGGRISAINYETKSN